MIETYSQKPIAFMYFWLLKKSYRKDPNCGEKHGSPFFVWSVK